MREFADLAADIGMAGLTPVEPAVTAAELRKFRDHRRAQLIVAVEPERLARQLGHGAQYRPVLAGLARRLDARYTRYADDLVLSGERGAWIVSLVVVSLLFGLGHVDRGIVGNVVNGLMLGGLYLATGRNLVAPILAHGIANTVELTLGFLGA